MGRVRLTRSFLPPAGLALALACWILSSTWSAPASAKRVSARTPAVATTPEGSPAPSSSQPVVTPSPATGKGRVKVTGPKAAGPKAAGPNGTGVVAPAAGQGSASVQPKVARHARHAGRSDAGAGAEAPAGGARAPGGVSADAVNRAAGDSKRGHGGTRHAEAIARHAAEKAAARERAAKERAAKEREAGNSGHSGATAARVDPPRAVAAPTAATQSAPTATVPPAIAAKGAAPASPARRAASRRPHSSTGATGRAPAASAPVSVLPVVAPVSTPTRAASAPVHRSKPRSQPASSPLVTTVTKIINVVPPLLRVLIGALVALALGLAVITRLAAMRARRLARQRTQLLEDVGLLQAALLPTLPQRLGPVATTAAYRPASGPAAGGDFYDLFALADGQVGVIVGDVSGHGRQALPHTTLLRFTLRAYLEAGLSPRSALRTAAPVLERQLGGSFATVVIATYDPRERILVYASAGHPLPIMSGTGGITPITACSAPPIGAGQQTGTRQTVVSVPGRTLACFYTDGVVEARVRGELFGSDRLESSLAELGPQATAASLLERVSEQTDRRPDDMAACLLGIEGEELSPQILVEELEIDRQESSRRRLERFLAAAGVGEQEITAVAESARRAVEREGSVVLQLRPDGAAPRITLRPNNVTHMTIQARAAATASEVLR